MMKAQPKKNMVRLLLPLGFSSLLLTILLCGLSQAIEAEPSIPTAATLRERNHPSSLGLQTGVSVCQQTENPVPNPGFERDAEQPHGQPDHWHEAGPEICAFRYDDPGPDSDHSAKIDASSPRDENCTLFVDAQDTPVEPGRFYYYSAMAQANLDPGDDAYLRIAFYSCQGDDCTYKEDARTESVTDTQERWVKVTGSAQAPADANYARVSAILPASSVGEVWFDDIFLGLATCLDVSKSAYPDHASRGELLTYTIVYSNTGREKATNVQIIETYDRYVDFEWAQPPPLTGTKNIWVVRELLPRVSGTVMVVVQVETDTEGSAWLFNNLLVLSDETTDLITATLPTPINGNGCDIALYIPIAEQPGEPGYSTEYSVNLENAGACDGQVNLVAASSKGWDVSIASSMPYTLPSGQPEWETVSITVPQNALSGTVDVTRITTTLVCGRPCSETVTATATLTTTVTSATGCRIYLPLVLLDWPPIPTLYPIVNADMDGDYTVSWSTIRSADSYVLEEGLEEAPDSACIGWQEVYSGSDTHYPISDKGAGRYCYRVKACDGWERDYLSNVERTGAWWEQEDNDSCSEANGELISGQDYHGYPNDYADCFKIHLDARGQVAMKLDNHTGGGVQLQLYYRLGDDKKKVCRDTARPYEITCDADKAGWYCIRIKTVSGYNSDTAYTLQAIFP
jgi:uncharacterized repeat protein (TIGR01451 family)